MSAKYHPGEIEVQERAGVRGMAERVGNGIHPVIPPAAREFLEEQPMVVVGSVGSDGRVWASMLAGEPGFARALDERTVMIDAAPVPGDPLAENLAAGVTAVGVIAIDLASRRRMRLNGKAEGRSDGIRVSAEQVYANCPKYIQAREWEKVAHDPGAGRRNVRRGGTLTDEQRRRISQADTFFVASARPGHGADASHRGGQPGFVRFLDDDTLEFPDYSGNTMFNTLGNIAANPDAGLLFVDFERGGTLQLAGEAKVVWGPERAARFVGAERVVEFRVDEVVEIGDALPLRWRFKGYSPFNPA